MATSRYCLALGMVMAKLGFHIEVSFFLFSFLACRVFEGLQKGSRCRQVKYCRALFPILARYLANPYSFLSFF